MRNLERSNLSYSLSFWERAGVRAFRANGGDPSQGPRIRITRPSSCAIGGSLVKLPPGVHSRFVRVGPFRVHYLEAGRGEPVVLLHSAEFGGRAEFSWRYNIGPLAEHFHVFAPDMLGFGYTDKIYDFGDPYTFRIRFIRDWMETLCI